ncbi:hypothetical protein [Bacillus sp. AK031]
MLTYKDIKKMTASSTGIDDPELLFESITAEADVPMPKGLFIPFSDEELFKSIHNGAVAAIWLKGRKLPAWLPNHFPLFITDNPIEDVLRILDDYYNNSKQEEWGKMTTFIFREEKGKLYKISEKEQYSRLKEIAEKSLLLKGGE